MKASRTSNVLLAAAVVLAGLPCLRGAEPADEINVAAAKWGATARASSEYGPAYAASHALDGRWQVRETDKWNSAQNVTPHWLLIDLGRPQSIHRIVIHHEGGVYITSGFQLQRGDTPDGPWTDLAPPIVGNKQEVSEHTFVPTAVRFLRLLITKAEQSGHEYARIFEVEAYASRKAMAGALASFDWVVPARYRKTGERVERLALLELLGGANGKLSLELSDRPAVAVDPQVPLTECWIPVFADQPVKAVVRRDGQVLVERTFLPPPETYFYNGGSVGIVSSSHQDTAWMDTPDFCRRFRIEQNIVPALEMMKKDPNYCFAMECTLHLMEFLEAHPERRDEILRLTKEGRMEWGATYNQPYESWLSGEELIRQVYYGRRWIRKNLPGCDARVAFNPDVPGRALQMQQILAKAGVPYLFTSRYHEGLYRWLSPDGSGVLAYTPGHYGNHLGMLNGQPENGVREIARKLVEQGAYYQQRALPPTYCLVNSMDFSKPTDFTRLIELWNRQGSAGVGSDPNALPPPVMGYTTFTRFFERIAKKDTKLAVLTGERPDVWLYIHGPTHHWTSSARREAARLLPAAETFTSVACLLKGSFSDWPGKELDSAWMDEIYMDHGIGGKNGHITDRVFHEKILHARDTGRTLLDKAVNAIAVQVKVGVDKGTPVTVFNTLAWTRSDPVEVTPPAMAGPLHVVDGDGKEVPSQSWILPNSDEVNIAAGALGAKVSASSAHNAQTGADRAIDGKWADRDADKWASAAGPGPHSLTIDFGLTREIHRVVIRHEGCMGAFREEAKYNTADFRIQGADAAEGPWTDLVPPVVGNTASLTSHSFAAKIVRFLRLYITKGTPGGSDGSARIYEVQAFGRLQPATRKLVFVATDVPSLGYRTWYLVPGEAKAAQTYVAKEDGCENAFYRVDLAPGGIRSLRDKELDRELLDTGKFLGGEVFTMLSVAPNNRGAGTDAGEFGAVPMPVMDASFDRVANHKPAWKLLENGPVRSVFGLELPWKNTRLLQRVVVWHTIRRVDCEVELKDFNGELWREFRMALPLAMDKPTIAYEVPMGVVEIGKDEILTTGGHAYGGLTYFEQCREIRPREVQNFIDASDERGGLTLTSDVSVFDWKDPTGDPTPRPVLQPVLLASRRSCNGEGNWYPQAGDHTYRFSITSHAGGWRNGWKSGIQANHAVQTVLGAKPAEGAKLPATMSFFSTSAGNVLISTVKKAEDDDGVVLRCYDIEGKEVEAKVSAFQPVKRAMTANIIEDDGKPLTLDNGVVKCTVGHHAIETVKLVMQTNE